MKTGANTAHSRPLEGRRVVLTRPEEPSRDWAVKLAAAGAEVIEMPLLRVDLAEESDRVREIFSGIGQYEWIIFTSANGVRGFFRLFFQHFRDIRSMGFMRIAAVGPATARAVAEYHLHPDLIPEKAASAHLAEALCREQTLDNLKILVAAGNRRREDLVKRLEKERAIVDVMPVYRTDYEDLREHPAARSFREKGADAVLFASGSAVESFLRQAEHLRPAGGARKPLTCSFGPSATEALRRAGLPVDAEAPEPALDAVIAVLAAKWGRV